LALKKQNFAEGEIAIFDEACVYKRGEYRQFRLWLAKENKYASKSPRTRRESTAGEPGKAPYLEIYGNLQQGKSYFSITIKEGVEKYLSFRKRDVELGHIVSERLATIATYLQHWLNFIGKDTKLKELERTDCENNMAARVFFWPLSSLPVFEPIIANKNAYSIPGRAINLPSYHDMREEDLKKINQCLKDVINGC